ncbi:MAG: HD domain-containing protein [Candidatus Riflebacteria bacterium]|nr:HD domain-containing protein [Candidatus Riflebacteria bacterium]
MNEKEFCGIKNLFESYVDRFRDQSGSFHSLLELKYQHSLRVAANSRAIAVEECFSEDHQFLAEAIGLLHDIGRFSQFSVFKSFRDADTIDHGAEGQRILESEKFNSLINHKDTATVFSAVHFHNRMHNNIPGNLSRQEYLFLNLIRDADKLDIFEIVLKSIRENGFRELSEMLPHVSNSRELTPGIIQEAMNNKSLAIGRLSTLSDFLIMIATWYYDLNLAASRLIASRRNFLTLIRSELPSSNEIDVFFERIRNTCLID